MPLAYRRKGFPQLPPSLLAKVVRLELKIEQLRLQLGLEASLPAQEGAGVRWAQKGRGSFFDWSRRPFCLHIRRTGEHGPFPWYQPWHMRAFRVGLV